MPQLQDRIKISQCRFRQKAKPQYTGGRFGKASYSSRYISCSNPEHRGLCSYHGGTLIWHCKLAREKVDVLPQQGKVRQVQEIPTE